MCEMQVRLWDLAGGSSDEEPAVEGAGSDAEELEVSLPRGIASF